MIHDTGPVDVHLKCTSCKQPATCVFRFSDGTKHPKCDACAPAFERRIPNYTQDKPGLGFERIALTATIRTLADVG